MITDIENEIKRNIKLKFSALSEIEKFSKIIKYIL